MTTLGFAYFLYDNLLRSLGGNATENDGLDRIFDHPANKCFAVQVFSFSDLFLTFFDSQVSTRYGKIFIGHNRPTAKGVIFTGCTVNGNTNINLIFVTFFCSRRQSGFHRLEDHFWRYTLFVGDGIHYQQNFFAHALPRISLNRFFPFGPAHTLFTLHKETSAGRHQNCGITFAFSIVSKGNRYSWSSQINTTSSPSTPEITP